MPLFQDLYPTVIDADTYVQSTDDELYNLLYTIIYNYTTGKGISINNIFTSILKGSIGKNSDFEIEQIFYLQVLINHLINFRRDVNLICGNESFTILFQNLTNCYQLDCIRNNMVCKWKNEYIFDQMYKALNLCGGSIDLSILWETGDSIDWES